MDTITKITQKYNSKKFILFIIINICLSSFTFGFFLGYFNSINFKTITQIYQLKEHNLSAMQGLLTGILSFTGGIGAYCSRHLLTTFSRKQCFQILSTSTIVTCLLLQIPTFPILFIARCFQGAIIGMISSITPLYIKQFVPTELSSSINPLNQVGIVGGLTFSFTLSFLLSLVMPPQIYWRIVFGFPIITSFIQLYNFKFHFPFETPKYLLLQNNTVETMNLLNIIYKKQYVQQVYKQLKLVIQQNRIRNSQNSDTGLTQQDLPTFRISHRSPSVKKPLTHQLLEISNSKHRQLQQSSKQQLVTNPLAKIAAIHLSVSQQMVGMSSIISYSGQTVGRMIPQIQQVFPIVINVIALAGAFLTIPALNMFGRKTNLNIGAVGLGTMLILVSIAFSNYNFDHYEQNLWLIKLSICLLLFGIRLLFCFTIGPVVWIYIAEIVQPNFIPLSTMINFFTVAIVNTVFPIIQKNFLSGNPSLIFMFFGVCTLCGYFINRVVLIETQHKTQFQIMKQYKLKYKSLKKR